MADIAHPLTFDSPHLTDTDGAAYLLNIPAKTICKWRSTGENNIPFVVRICKKVLYRPTDLKAYVDRHLVGGGRHDDPYRLNPFRLDVLRKSGALFPCTSLCKRA